MEDLIKCPHCGKSYFEVLYKISACLYSPAVYKNGKWIFEDPNKTLTHCHCLECGKEFSF